MTNWLFIARTLYSPPTDGVNVRDGIDCWVCIRVDGLGLGDGRHPIVQAAGLPEWQRRKEGSRRRSQQRGGSRETSEETETTKLRRVENYKRLGRREETQRGEVEACAEPAHSSCQ